MKAGRDVLLFTTAIIYLGANTRTERITAETVHQTEMILLKESREGKKMLHFLPPTCEKMHYRHGDVSSHDALRLSLGIMAAGPGTRSINHSDGCHVYPSEACRNSICTVQLFRHG